jgi:hypothetical protein
MTIHYVNVNAIGAASFRLPNLLAQLRKIRGQYGWRQLYDRTI